MPRKTAPFKRGDRVQLISAYGTLRPGHRGTVKICVVSPLWRYALMRVLFDGSEYEYPMLISAGQVAPAR